MTEKETRLYDIEELRADSRNVEGYAIVFNKESRDLGGFTEIIVPTALDGVLESQDVLALMNHDDGKVLARYRKGKGSLKLTVDETGLRYSFEPPKTNLGEELIEGLKRGDISNSSFAFTVDQDEVVMRADNVPLRKINKFKKIYDVSPVYHPAYEDTSVALRSIDKIKNDESLKDYFTQLEERITKLEAK